MSQWVVDASLTLAWYLKDEKDRAYPLAVLAGLREHDIIVPFLWTYEVANALVMACRRKRVTVAELTEILESLKMMPITLDPPHKDGVLALPPFALQHQLTGYDAAYLELAFRLKVAIATVDVALKQAAAACGVPLVQP